VADITESIERPIWCIVINQCWCGFVMATVTSTPRLPKEEARGFGGSGGWSGSLFLRL